MAAKTHEWKSVCMASQIALTYKEPVGKSAALRLPTVEAKLNIVTMNVQTLDIHFGVIQYPPWVKKWIRWWELYDSILKLAENPALKVPPPPEFISNIKGMINNRDLAREPEWERLA